MAGAGEVAGGFALCATGAGCLLTAARLALFAYATKDAWLPAIEGLWRHTHNGDHNGGAGTVSCDPGVGVYTSGSQSVVSFMCSLSNATGFTSSTEDSWCINPNSSTSLPYESAAGSHAGSLSSTPNQHFLSCALPDVPYAFRIQALNDQTSAAEYAYMWKNPAIPDRASDTYTVTVTCRKTDGTSADISQTSVANGGALHMPSCAAVYPGSHMTSMKITGSWSGTIPLNAPLETITPPNDQQYPNCGLTQGTVCKLQVRIDGVPCVVGAAQCETWTEKLADPVERTRLSCYWGNYSVPIQWCYVLERAYYPAGAYAYDGNIDGNPATSVGTAPDGTPTSTTSPQPSASVPPSSLPTTGTNPGGVGSPDPGVSGNGCTGLSWSWNPIDWVLIPVKCALEWAFVPDESTLGALETQVSNAFNSTGVGAWFSAITGLFGGLGGSGGGCSGPEVTFSMVGINKTMHPFDACSAPMSTVASISYAFSTVLVIVFGALAGVKALGSAFGFQVHLGDRLKADT